MADVDSLGGEVGRSARAFDRGVRAGADALENPAADKFESARREGLLDLTAADATEKASRSHQHMRLFDGMYCPGRQIGLIAVTLVPMNFQFDPVGWCDWSKLQGDSLDISE